MTGESKEGEYSDDEIEQILGMGSSELILKEIEETIRDDPLLVTGLVFALGILIGVGLACGGKGRSAR